MLAKRVVLLLTFNESVLMRSKTFHPDYRYTQGWAACDDADEVTLLDITRGRPDPSFPDLVAKFARKLTVPCSVGGHVRSLDYARKLLNSGADKIVVGWSGREAYEQLAYQWGRQVLVAGIDHDDHGCVRGNDRNLAEVAREAQTRGAGEILLQSVPRDGSLTGYDLPNLQQTVASVSIPVVVGGGCGKWADMGAAFRMGAQGAATSVIHHLAPSAMRACKQWLKTNCPDIEIREAA